MAVTSDTNVGALKQSLIGTLVQRELSSKGVLTQAVTDVSEFAVKGAKAISFPKANSFVVQNRASGQMANIQNLDFALDTMPLDQRATVAWIIDAMDEAQVSLDLQGVYAVRAASAHAKAVDARIVATLDAAAQSIGSGALTDANLLAMRKAAIKAEADRDNLMIACGPDSEASMLAIDKFVRYDALGTAPSPIRTGLLGTFYGMKAFVTSQITDASFYIFDKSAVAIGFQREPQMDERKAPEYGSNSLLKVLDQLYGTVATQIAVNGAPTGKSALIFKNAAGS